MKYFRNISEVQIKIIDNVFWSLIGKITNLAGALFVGILVARYLGPEQYGLMNYIISFVSLFLILATFGFENIEIREEAKNENEKNVIIGTTFTMRVVLSLITILIIALAAYINESDSRTFILIMIYSISVIMSPFDVIRNYFTSQVQNKYIVKVGIFRTFFSCILKILLLYLHATLIFFVISLVIDAAILAQGYCYIYKKKAGLIRYWRFDKKWAIYILRQSFPLLLSGAAATIFLQIDQIMIGNMIDKASVGYFSIASKFVEILIYIPTILIQTVCPILVRLKKEDVEAYKIKSQQFMNITVWLCVTIAIFMSVISYYIISITFGSAYIYAVVPLQILSFKVVGASLNIVSGQILIIDEKQKLFVLRSLSGCLICILLNYVVIPEYGIKGVAIVAIITQFTAGFLIHAIIPQYRYIFAVQTKALLFGWKDLIKIRNIIRK